MWANDIRTVNRSENRIDNPSTCLIRKIIKNRTNKKRIMGKFFKEAMILRVHIYFFYDFSNYF